MKRVILIALMLCLLCGCGDEREQQEPAVLIDTVPATQATEDGLIDLQPRETLPEIQPEPTASAIQGPGEAQYSVVEYDDSIRNDDGDALVTILYQRVLLVSTQPQWDAVNDLIRADYQTFREETAYLHETAHEDWEAMLQDMDPLQSNFMAVRNARVTNNSGGILSIRMQQEWFMGGVFNSDAYGLNFDLSRGEALPLGRLSDLSQEEFEAQLKTIVCEALEKDRELLFDDPEVILAEYTLEDFSFCIDRGELVLLFPTYTFGPGAMGSWEIRTGLYPSL